jgi:spore maturation protein CgeB
MRFVIFGLTVSSSWGNGHATLWRGLLKAMSRRGHTAVFYERDVPYYSTIRDRWMPPERIRVQLYDSVDQIRADAERELSSADVALVTSYCFHGREASRLIFDSQARLSIFYDLDTPVTLDFLQTGRPVPYLPEEGLSGFDLVLSYTGGRALSELQTQLGATAVAPLYGWVDPEAHAPSAIDQQLRSALSYLGTYAPDRQASLEELFINTAHLLPDQRFLIGGAQYPEGFPWAPNIYFVRHLPPALHPGFFCSSRATLNVTRRVMAEYGFCPSGRLFEATACGVPLLSDTWEGLESFFVPGEEILPVRTCSDVLNSLSLTDRELRIIAEAGRTRTLEHHTAEQRLMELESICGKALAGRLAQRA